MRPVKSRRKHRGDAVVLKTIRLMGAGVRFPPAA